MNNTSSYQRRGITMVEVLVCLGVIGILLAIILPAIQAARSTAWRMQCQSSMKQLAIAVHSYESSWSVLPSGYRGASVFVTLRHELGSVLDESQFVNQAEFLTKLNGSMTPLMRCSADSGGSGGNFASNHGLTVPVMSGPFGFLSSQIAAVTDGTSQTAMFSEWLRGPGSMPNPPFADRSNPRRLIFNVVPFVSDPGQAEGLWQKCQTLDVSLAAIQSAHRGSVWFANNAFESGYNHQYLPNQRACANAGTGLLSGLPPSSQHNGGVNVFFADGSGRLVSENIDLRVWQAMGTRAGSETVALY